MSWGEAPATPGRASASTGFAFDAPLWVLFSSGTTGLPKGIVHGHGGVLLEHHKMLGLHLDLGPGRPLFWYTTTNWMMWNIVASGLLLAAPVVLYDGSPTHPGPQRLWQIAAEYRVHVLGVSPGYLQACAAAGVRPGVELDLRPLQALGVTGAPLTAPPYRWVHDAVGPWVQVASTSGGTDVVTGFAGSAPTTPVWPGEISAPMLGVALAAWNSAGQPVTGEVGELVVTAPMPSMPLSFWNDPGGRRYRDAYFSTYPGVWRHGDWAEVTDRGSVLVSGRSDATLNRGGVRLGSADIYRAVDGLGPVKDALVVGAELGDGGYWLVLFVVLADGAELTGELIREIKSAVRAHASPRHVPDDVIAVAALPHTRTGKRLEVPVKRLIQGHPLDQVASPDAVDDFAALAQFTGYAGTATGRRHDRVRPPAPGGRPLVLRNVTVVDTARRHAGPRPRRLDRGRGHRRDHHDRPRCGHRASRGGRQRRRRVGQVPDPRLPRHARAPAQRQAPGRRPRAHARPRHHRLSPDGRDPRSCSGSARPGRCRCRPTRPAWWRCPARCSPRSTRARSRTPSPPSATRPPQAPTSSRSR